MFRTTITLTFELITLNVGEVEVLYQYNLAMNLQWRDCLWRMCWQVDPRKPSTGLPYSVYLYIVSSNSDPVQGNHSVTIVRDRPDLLKLEMIIIFIYNCRILYLEGNIFEYHVCTDIWTIDRVPTIPGLKVLYLSWVDVCKLLIFIQ